MRVQTLIFMMLCLVSSYGLCCLAETGTMSCCFSPSSGLRHATLRYVTPVLRHMPCYAMRFFAVQCYAMASFRLSALTGVIGTFDSPLSFSDSSEFRYATPCHAMPWLSFRPSALTGVIGTFDGPLSFSDSSEFRHAMPWLLSGSPL